jgi:EmrB/QacA subfamily drug resistance transporter
MKSMPKPLAIATTARAQPEASPRWALVSLAFSMLLSSLGSSIANVGLPTLARTFDASFQDVQWVVLAYLLASTTLIVSVGRLGDLFGRRRLMLGGILLFTAASTLCGTAATLWLLIAARALQGLGAAIMLALSMALIGETLPKAQTGRAMGLLGSMSAIGTALGPPLGGLLIAAGGWQAIFLVNLPLGLLAWFLTWRQLPADRPPAQAQPARFDHLGSLLLAMALAAYAFAMTLGRGTFGPLNAALLLASAGCTGLFLLVEARVAAPLVRLTLFRDPALGASFAMSALVMTVMMTTLVVGPFYLAGALGLDTAQVGLVMAAGPLVSALTGVPAGRLVDRLGAQRMTRAGLATLLAGALLLPRLPPSLGVAGYIGPLMLITAGYALFQAANNTAVMADVRPDQRGVVSGLLNLSRNLGLITGASLMGALFALGAATGDQAMADPGAIAAGLRITFSVGAALILLTLLISFASQARAAQRRS